MSSNMIRAACFALGVAVGGGVVAVGMTSRKRTLEPVLAGAYEPGTSIGKGSIVKSTPLGLPDLAKTAETVTGSVLKYGNPGALCRIYSARLPSQI